MLMGSSTRVARMVTPVASRAITSGGTGGGGPKICVGGSCNPPCAVAPPAGTAMPIPVSSRASRQRENRGPGGRRSTPRAMNYRAPSASASSSRAISSVAVMPVFPS